MPDSKFFIHKKNCALCVPAPVRGERRVYTLTRSSYCICPPKQATSTTSAERIRKRGHARCPDIRRQRENKTRALAR
jgi:hypothetical protein